MAEPRIAPITDDEMDDQTRDLLAGLGGGMSKNNLFGMDLNSEAIEIGRLSLWIKTAQNGKVLTSLDDNVKQGQQRRRRAGPADGLAQRFPAAGRDGGFDVVIGNPPYVRQEWIAKDKPFLEKHYRLTTVSRILRLLLRTRHEAPEVGGRLGFISSNSYFKAAYAEALCRLLTTTGTLEQIVDLGDTQIFPDAKDVYPAIAIIAKGFRSKGQALRTLRLRRHDRAELMKEYLTNSRPKRRFRILIRTAGNSMIPVSSHCELRCWRLAHRSGATQGWNLSWHHLWTNGSVRRSS